MKTLVVVVCFIGLFGYSNAQSLQEAAVSLTINGETVVYDPSYFRIPYPMGDVPADRGVCTDVVIRAYRKIGVDLQRLVHEDMKRNFDEYPNLWGRTSPDPNIDHRRVPNLVTYFKRYGKVLPVTDKPSDYQPGDIVWWTVGGANHIGIVVDYDFDGVCGVVHNIGSGQKLDNFLFLGTIVGHYRY